MKNIALAAALTLFLAPAAHATNTLTFAATDIGQGYAVTFSGITDSYQNHLVALPGLNAKVVILLKSITANSWTFDYAVANTSGGNITSSRISVFGFDVDPDATGKSSTGLFGSPSSGNVPILGRREVCFRTGNGGQCAGGGGGGVKIGDAAAAGTFTLTFQLSQTAVDLKRLFVRYQSLTSPNDRIAGASGVGEATGVAAVPEPQTWAMLIAGFGLVGGALRRRRVAVA